MKKNNFNINISASKRKGVSIIILIFSIFAILSLAGLVVDLGIIFNCRYELQKAVESSALAAISEYEAYEDNTNTIRYPAIANISTNANSVTNNYLNAFIKSNSFLLLSSEITPTITFGTSNRSKYSRAIRIDATAVARTYFLNLIGVKSIKLQASAAAMHIPVYLKSWNILNGAGTYKDTDIREPLSGTAAGLPTIANVNSNLNNLNGFPDGSALSLGPGGYITIKLPASLVDGKGFDLQIITAGNANGYFVFAGNDIDPATPYVDSATTGSGIQWKNISCTGTPVGSVTNGRTGSYKQNIGGVFGSQAEFYGSGYFDLGARCTDSGGAVVYNGSIRTAKYLKIIDDNIEDGFILKDLKNDADINAMPSLFPGQNSSFTPGVSIDAISIEHHSRLISLNDFNTDTDNDGLLDVFETSLGLGSCGSSDGVQNCIAPAVSNDAAKLWGYANTGAAGVLQDNPTSGLRIDYPTRTDNPPRMYINY